MTVLPCAGLYFALCSRKDTVVCETIQSPQFVIGAIQTPCRVMRVAFLQREVLISGDPIVVELKASRSHGEELNSARARQDNGEWEFGDYETKNSVVESNGILQ